MQQRADAGKHEQRQDAAFEIAGRAAGADRRLKLRPGLDEHRPDVRLQLPGASREALSGSAQVGHREPLRHTVHLVPHSHRVELPEQVIARPLRIVAHHGYDRLDTDADFIELAQHEQLAVTNADKRALPSRKTATAAGTIMLRTHPRTAVQMSFPVHLRSLSLQWYAANAKR